MAEAVNPWLELAGTPEDGQEPEQEDANESAWMKLAQSEDQPTLDANESVMAAHDSGVNPDQASEAFDIANENNTDMDTVLTDKQYWTAPKPMDNVNPVTSNFMKNYGTVFSDSVQPMNDVEIGFKNIQKNKHLYGGGNAEKSYWTVDGESLFTRGVNSSEEEKRYNELTFKEFMGDATPADITEVQAIEYGMRQRTQPTEGQSWIVSPIQEIADSAGEYVRGLEYMPEAFKQGAMLTANPTAGAVIAMQAPSVNTFYEGIRDEGMGYWREMRDYRDLDGNPLDDDVLRGSTYFLMATSGAIENVPVFKALKKVFPQADNLIQMFSKKGMKELMKIPTVKQAFGKFGKSFAGGITTEAATELFQSVISDLTSNVAISQGAGRASPDDIIGVSEMLGNATKAFYEGVKGGWMMQGGASGVELSSNIYQAKKAQSQINEITNITANLNNDNLGKKSKTLTAQFIKDSAKKYDVSDSVLVEQEVVERFYQETGMTADEFAKEFPQTQSSMNDSFEAGGDIQVPLDELARIEVSEKGEELLNNFRVSPDAPTQAEIYKVNEEIAESDRQREAEAEKSPIFEDIYQQSINAGSTPYTARQHAVLWAGMVEAQAQAQNISVEEAYSGNKLDLSEEYIREANIKDNYERLDSIMDTIRKGKQPTGKQAYGMTATEYLSDKGGLIDTGGELSARDVGKIGTKNLIQPLEKGGLTLDQAIESMVEGGYLSGDTSQYTHEDVFSLIDDELGGVPTYAEEQRTGDADLYEEIMGIEDMFLRMGIDLGTMSNEEVKQTLKDSILFQDAYHGTHAKDIEQFLTDYIGTGEGAQAQGAGLYFASDKGIADWYRKSVSKQQGAKVQTTLDGEIVEHDGTKNDPQNLALDMIAGMVRALDMDTKKAVSYSKEKIQEYIDLDIEPDTWKPVLDWMNDNGDRIGTKDVGQTYKVDLKPKEEEYLLWDKPMSEQSDTVKQAVINKGDGWAIDGETGQSYYQKLTDFNTAQPDENFMVDKGEGQRVASLELLNSGIRGIKYSDATTRGKEGEQSFNYVIFDDRDVEITETFYQKTQDRKKGFKKDVPLAGKGMGSATWDDLTKAGYKPSDADGTQITTTKGTYKKIADQFIDKDTKILDYSGGLGAGSKALSDEGYQIDMYEPFYQEAKGQYEPKFTDIDAKDIPDNSYDVIINNAVLNVVPEETRKEIINNIYKKLKPNGKAYISLMGLNNIKPRFDKGTIVGENEVITTKGTFQKGYSQQGFMAWANDVLPDDAVIATDKFGDVSIVLEKPETTKFYQKAKKPKKMSRTEYVGTLENIQKDFPAQYDAIQNQIDALDKKSADKLRENLEKYKGTAWSVVALKGLVLREIFTLGFNNKPFDELTTPTYWSKEGKLDIAKYKMFKVFATGNKTAIKAFAQSYEYFSSNAKAETDISGSFAACDPTKGCAETCYSANGTGGNFSTIAKSEFTEWVANNYLDELVDNISVYKAFSAGQEGFMLRLNERGDLTPAQVKLIKGLNAKGIKLQVFSKQPDLLREVPPENWRALSVDTTNVDVIADYPELDVALTLTEDFTPDMMDKVKDRLRVVLPLHTKSKDKIWTRKELFEKFPNAKKEIGKTLCPVIIDGKKVSKDVNYQAILSDLKGSEFWTCTTCDALGMKCFGADTKVKAEGLAKEYAVNISSIGGRKTAQEKAREKAIKGFEELLKIGAIDGQQLAELTKNLDETLDGTREELDTTGSEPVPEDSYEANKKDAASRRRSGDLPPETGEGNETFYQQETDAKGYYERTPLRDVFRITLTGKADMSTFLHESGHAFLDMMIRDAEKFDYAKKELDTLMKWMGVDSPDQIQTDQHEQFARGFEAYLREGKAPSIELREAFRNFKLWLTNIYKRFSQLDVELTPEVRGVMDRMLATREQINEARNSAGILPMYDEASQTQKIGMSEEQYNVYRKKYNDAMQYEMEKLDSMRIKQYNKTVEFMNKDRRNKAKAQAEKNLQVKYRAELGMKKSKSWMAKDSVSRVFPDIPKRLRGLYRKNEGVDVDLLAMEYGYEDGVEMVTEMANLPPYKDALVAESAAILEAEYGEQEKIPSAKEIVHGEKTSDFIKSELITLGKREGVVNHIKQVARERIAFTQISKIKPIYFERAERKASIAAARALANGDRATAALEKQKQLLNHHLFKEGTKALRQADKQYTFMKKFSKKTTRSRIGKAGSDYLAAIDNILGRTQLKKVSDKFLDRKVSITKYVNKMRGDGAPVPKNLDEMISYTNYRELTVNEFDYAYQAVKNIDSAARNKKKFIDRKNKRELEEVTGEISGSIRNSKVSSIEYDTVKDKSTNWIRKGDAELVKFEFLTRWMDGGEVAGKVWKALFKPMQTAEEEHMEMSLKYTKDVIDIINRFGKKWKGSSMFLGKKMDKSQIISIALNMGNQGNIQRLTDGYGWTYDKVMQELERTLTVEDMQGVQDLWDKINELYKPMAEVAQRVEGEAPEKVVSVPFKFKGKTYDGGYYPAVYDPRFSTVGEKQITADGYLADGAKKASATKLRAEKVNGVILLDLKVIPKHVDETIFYITHYEAISNVNKVLSHSNVKSAIVDKYGDEYYKTSKGWLNAIANQGNVAGEESFFERQVGKLRGVTSIGAMGYSITTVMMQPFGMFNTINEVGAYNTSVAILKFLSNPAKQWKRLEEKYPEFDHLINSFDRDLKQNIDKSVLQHPVIKAQKQLTRHAFWPIGIVQKVINGITLIAAENKYQNDDSLTYEQARDKAKSVVRMTQSMAGQKDLASVQNRPMLKLLTMFYSFFSALYGQGRSGLRRGDANTAGEIASKAMTAAKMYTLLFVIPEVLNTIMRGTCEEEEEIVACYGWQVAIYTASPFPLIRDVFSGMISKYPYKATPIEGIVTNLISTTKKIGEWEMEDRERIIKAYAPLLGIPPKLLTQPLRFFDDDFNKNQDMDEWREFLQLKKPE